MDCSLFGGNFYGFQKCEYFLDYLGITLVPVIVLTAISFGAYKRSALPPLIFYLVDLYLIFNPQYDSSIGWLYLFSSIIVVGLFYVIGFLREIKFLKDNLNKKFDEKVMKIDNVLEKLNQSIVNEKNN